MPDLIPSSLSVSDAASAIVALINSQPRSPTKSQIEAIIAKVAGAPAADRSGQICPNGAPADSELLQRWLAAEANYLKAFRGDMTGAACDAADREAGKASVLVWSTPISCWGDVVARARVALFWRWPLGDDSMAERLQAVLARRGGGPLDESSVAPLINAVLQLEGAALAPLPQRPVRCRRGPSN